MLFRSKNHGGLISSIVNKDKEVEIVYHNIRSISSNCDNDNRSEERRVGKECKVGNDPGFHFNRWGPTTLSGVGVFMVKLIIVLMDTGISVDFVFSSQLPLQFLL